MGRVVAHFRPDTIAGKIYGPTWRREGSRHFPLVVAVSIKITIKKILHHNRAKIRPNRIFLEKSILCHKSNVSSVLDGERRKARHEKTHRNARIHQRE